MATKPTIPVEVEQGEMPRGRMIREWCSGAIKVSLLAGGLLGGLWLLQLIAKN
jgi:hypothetical protein